MMVSGNEHLVKKYMIIYFLSLTYDRTWIIKVLNELKGKNKKQHSTEKGGRRMLGGECLKFKICLLVIRLNHLKFSSHSTYIFLTSFPIIHQREWRNRCAWTLPLLSTFSHTEKFLQSHLEKRTSIVTKQNLCSKFLNLKSGLFKKIHITDRVDWTLELRH